MSFRPSDNSSVSNQVSVHLPYQPDIPEPRRRLPVELLLTLPPEGFKDYERIDEPVRLLLSQIEQQKEVTITVQNAGLAIIGATKLKVSNALAAVYEVLKCRPGEGNLWRPRIMIDPRCWPQGPATIKLDVSANQFCIGAHPVLVKDDAVLPTLVPDKAALDRYHNTFRTEFSTVFENLRFVSAQMQMRVTYGSVRLDEWKRDKPEYERVEFEQVVKKASRRGTCRLDKLIGDHDSGRRILQDVLRSTGRFSPIASRISHLHEVLPTHKMIFLLPSHEVEANIIMVDGEAHNTRHEWRFSTVNAYRREQRSQQLSLLTSSPQLPLDWCLEVKIRLAQERIPFNFQDVSKNVTLGPCIEQEVFPEVKVNPQFGRDHEILAVMSQTTSSFHVDGSPYHLDVSVYQRWDINDASAVESGAGVELYGSEWDDQMYQAELAGRSRDWNGEDFSDFFVEDPASGRVGLDAFFHRVQEHQTWLAGLLEKTDA